MDNSLDDIFGSSPPHEQSRPILPPAPSNPAEPSELPSLRRQHVTAGYRDGISASKGEHVQAGFDAGFPVGAQLGMRAGTILGILEGILRGYESRASSAVVKKPAPRGRGAAPTTGGPTKDDSEAETEARKVKRAEILRLYQQATKELDVQAVFAGLDGTGGEKPEVQLGRKGEMAVSAWEKRVNVAHWEENMAALEAKDNEEAAADREGTVTTEQS
ncbi:hypothetical protein BDV59DRAFT_46103 [Aspergillus ambiguus]|uniref:Yae1 family protein n=1 Tax=Aspergillus ambiguus TaxID=176160 RepID=UPI003CCE342C